LSSASRKVRFPGFFQAGPRGPAFLLGTAVRVSPHRGSGRLLVGWRMNINYLVGVLCLILWIVALIDCLKSSNPNKIVWIIVIILLPFLGSILYFLIGKRS
jgi:hypothetical protein